MRQCSSIHRPTSNAARPGAAGAIRNTLLLVTLVLLGPAHGPAFAGSQSPEAGEGVQGGALPDYTVGVFLLESDQPRQAIPHLESAWSMSDHNGTIGIRLSEAYFQAGDLRACDKVLEEVLDDDETSYAALLLRAKVQYLLGGRERAVEYLRDLQSSFRPSFEVERLLGRILFELGRDEEALQSYADAIRIDPNYPFIHYKYGLLLRKYDRGPEAERAFKNAIELHPTFTEAVLELAEMMIDGNRPEEAEAVLMNLLSQDGDFPDAVVMAANLYADQGKPQRAIQLLQDQGRRNGLPRDGVLLLGKLHYEAGDFEKALVLFESLYDEEAKNPDLSRVLAEISLKAGDRKRALDYYRRAIEGGPDNYRNYMALFFASSERFSTDESPVIELSDAEKAELLRSASERLAEDDFDGTYIVGVAYQSIDAYETAKEFLDRAVALRPGDERALLNLATVLERLGQHRAAEAHLVKLHRLNPEDPTVCNFYGYLLALMSKDLDKAERLVRTALRQDPGNGYYIDSLGWVYYKRGEYDRAVIELEKAAAIVADDPVILEHLGDAYRSLRQFHKALAAYERSRELQGENTEILEKIDAARRQLGN